jgi:phosphate/sulfate permease
MSRALRDVAMCAIGVAVALAVGVAYCGWRVMKEYGR